MAVRKVIRQLLQVFLHPGEDLFHAVNPVFGLAAAGKLVSLVMEQYHLGGAAVHLQGSEHGNALRHPAAVILIGMDEQGRRFTVGSGRQR